MRNSTLHLVYAVLALVLGAAAEELLPKPAGVGFPVLLAAVQFMAVRRVPVAMALFAIAAGAAEDAVSSLPLMTSVSYFLPVAVATRWAELPCGLMALSYPLYQFWLRLWGVGLADNVFDRLLVSVPVGLVTAFAVAAVLSWTERRVSLDAEG